LIGSNAKETTRERERNRIVHTVKTNIDGKEIYRGKKMFELPNNVKPRERKRIEQRCIRCIPRQDNVSNTL